MSGDFEMGLIRDGYLSADYCARADEHWATVMAGQQERWQKYQDRREKERATKRNRYMMKRAALRARHPLARIHEKLTGFTQDWFA